MVNLLLRLLYSDSCRLIECNHCLAKYFPSGSSEFFNWRVLGGREATGPPTGWILVISFQTKGNLHSVWPSLPTVHVAKAPFTSSDLGSWAESPWFCLRFQIALQCWQNTAHDCHTIYCPANRIALTLSLQKEQELLLGDKLCHECRLINRTTIAAERHCILVALKMNVTQTRVMCFASFEVRFEIAGRILPVISNH